MENQKITSEIIKPINEKIEQQPTEKDSSTILLNINNNIENKNQINIDTKNKIDDIRSQLGLPPSDEIPPSIKTEEEAIGKLNQEKTNLENQRKISEVNLEIQNENVKRFEGNLRSAIDDISIKSKTMMQALDERQQERFTPLQNIDEFRGLDVHLRGIKTFDGNFDVNGLDQINENIKKISSLIQKMELKRNGGTGRDNPQNLEKLAFGAKSFSVSLDEASRNLGPELADEKMEEKRKELKQSLAMLSQQTQELNYLATKIRSNFH